MTNDEPIRVEVQPGAAAAMEDRLRAAQLDFHYRIEHDEKRRTRRGVFTVTQAVMASVRFVPDYERGVVSAMLRNVDRFETGDARVRARRRSASPRSRISCG